MPEMDLISYLIHPNAKYVVVPVISLVLSTLIKYYSQNDKYAVVSWDLFYWSPNLMTTALLLIFINFGAGEKEHSGNAFAIFLVVFLLMTLLIRKKGWVTDPSNQVKHSRIWGIIIPNIIGLAFLYYILTIFTL